MVFVGLGIVLGGLIGLLSVDVGGLPVSLTASGGALIMGLVFGWLRSVYPTFGRIPAPALWVFDTMGLAVFVGVIGLDVGPEFLDGLRRTGWALLVAGIGGGGCAERAGAGVRAFRLEDESGDSVRGVRGCKHQHGSPGAASGTGAEQGSGHSGIRSRTR